MNNNLPVKTILEPGREIKVFCEADVIVVGGGPAGVGAAVASARTGAKTVLVERYGHLGGLSTGGLVILIMPMSDGTAELQIAGICQEIVDRLDQKKAALHPEAEEIGSSDENAIKHWRHHSFCVVEGKIRMAVFFDPEALKCVINEMCEEAGVIICLHSWGTRTIVENAQVKGIFFESKSGRQAILGKVLIDASGDGDIYASAGCAFDTRLDPKSSRTNMALVARLANVDVKRYIEFKTSNREKFARLMNEVVKVGGFNMLLRSWREDVIWVNNQIPNRFGLNVEDLTWVEVNARKKMQITQNFLQQNIPGFEKCYIMDTASQVGVRCTRRLIGEYVLTQQDLKSGVVFDDTIAICPDFRHNLSAEFPHWYIPYRSLLAREYDNLLVAGRCFSADPIANEMLDPIQSCICMGQAAGTAAALAIKHNVQPKDLDYKVLQASLIAQGVPLPR